MITVHWKDKQFRLSNTAGDEWEPAANAWTPLEMMEGALALCIGKSLLMVMERDEVEADAMTITLHTQKASAGASRAEKFHLEVTLPPYLGREYQEKLLRHASAICTVGNTIKRGAEIAYELQ